MATKTQPRKPAKAKASAQSEEGLYSLSKLAEYFELDRATMRKRLEDANVKPVIDQAKKKLYRLEDAEAAMEAEDDLDVAKLKKLDAEAELKLLELERARGNLLSRKEVEDTTQKLFSAMYQRVVVRLPREIGAQLFKADSTARLTTILQTSLQTIFNELRTDHSRFLGSDQKSHS